MLRSLKRVVDIYLRHRTHCQSLGRGNAVTAELSNQIPDTINITIQSKLTPQDVIDGKAIYFSEEWVNTRGGKRVIDLELSYSSSVLLHRVLGEVLKDAESRQRCQMALGELDSSIDNIFMDETHGVH
jgi:hypothetical protein